MKKVINILLLVATLYTTFEIESNTKLKLQNNSDNKIEFTVELDKFFTRPKKKIIVAPRDYEVLTSGYCARKITAKDLVTQKSSKTTRFGWWCFKRKFIVTLSKEGNVRIEEKDY